MKQPPSAKSLEQIRINARRRLIGAIVLVVLAIAILPWLLKSKPREGGEVQVPVDLTQPRGTTAEVVIPEVIQPPAQEQPIQIDVGQVTTPQGAGVSGTVEPALTGPTTIGTTAGTTATVGQAPTASSKEGYAKRPTDMSQTSSKIKPGESFPKVVLVDPADGDAAHAAELMGQDPSTIKTEGSTTTASTNTGGVPIESPDDAFKNFTIQVGAYADAAKVSEVRANLSLAGYTSYTQEVQSGALGKVTRVRVGPITGRKQAEELAKKFKAMGLPANVLPG